MLTIYGKENCAYCKKAVQLAQNRDVEFVYKQLEEPGNIEELKARLPKGLPKVTVPQIWSFNHYIGTYDNMVGDIDNIVNSKYNTLKL